MNTLNSTKIVKKITRDNAITYYNDLNQSVTKTDLQIDHLSLLNDLYIWQAINGVRNCFTGAYKRAYFIGLKHSNQTKQQSHQSDMCFLKQLIKSLS